MLEVLRRGNGAVDKKEKEDDTLVVLYDRGYDSGNYSHVKVQYGLVDARTVQSAISEEEGGYQRVLHTKRIVDITSDFHWARLNPITICIRKDGNRYNVDGQARVSSVRTLYRKGEISTPMIPCIILTNTTLEDEAMLFGTQDDGKTQLREHQRVKSKYIGKDEKICDLAETLEECGIGLFKDIQANKTIQSIYNDFVIKNDNKETFKRFCKVISKAWLNGTKNQRKNATCADILNGLSVFYSKYADVIDDKNLTNKLSMTTPDAVRELFENYKNKLDPDRKYLKTFTEIYNKSKRSNNRIDYI